MILNNKEYMKRYMVQYRIKNKEKIKIGITNE